MKNDEYAIAVYKLLKHIFQKCKCRTKLNKIRQDQVCPKCIYRERRYYEHLRSYPADATIIEWEEIRH